MARDQRSTLLPQGLLRLFFPSRKMSPLQKRKLIRLIRDQSKHSSVQKNSQAQSDIHLYYYTFVKAVGIKKGELVTREPETVAGTYPFHITGVTVFGSINILVFKTYTMFFSFDFPTILLYSLLILQARPLCLQDQLYYTRLHTGSKW